MVHILKVFGNWIAKVEWGVNTIISLNREVTPARSFAIKDYAFQRMEWSKIVPLWYSVVIVEQIDMIVVEATKMAKGNLLVIDIIMVEGGLLVM